MPGMHVRGCDPCTMGLGPSTEQRACRESPPGGATGLDGGCLRQAQNLLESSTHCALAFPTHRGPGFTWGCRTWATSGLVCLSLSWGGRTGPSRSGGEQEGLRGLVSIVSQEGSGGAGTGSALPSSFGSQRDITRLNHVQMEPT